MQNLNLLVIALLCLNALTAAVPVPSAANEVSSSPERRGNWWDTAVSDAENVANTAVKDGEDVAKTAVKDGEKVYHWSQSPQGKQVINDGKKVYDWSKTPQGQSTINGAINVGKKIIGGVEKAAPAVETAVEVAAVAK
jgi:hypothetical protein